MGSCKKFFKNIHTPKRDIPSCDACIYSQPVLCARENFVGFQYLHKENNNSKANLQRGARPESEFPYFFFWAAKGAAAWAEIEFLHVFLFSVNAAKLFRLELCAPPPKEKCKHKHRNRGTSLLLSYYYCLPNK
jgi:hypothetical protein